MKIKSHDTILQDLLAARAALKRIAELDRSLPAPALGAAYRQQA